MTMVRKENSERYQQARSRRSMRPETALVNWEEWEEETIEKP
jgi:hypothetical protein